MPVNVHCNCVFIHIPKTAGTSIEAALGMHGSVMDVGVRPYLNQEADYSVFFGMNLQHLTALELRENESLPLSFDKAFKFTIVRNPWDRLISALAFGEGLANAHHRKSRDFIQSKTEEVYALWKADKIGENRHLMPQTRYFLDENRQRLVDRIGRYESLDDEFNYLRDKFQLPFSIEHRMKSNHAHYTELYSAEMMDMVAEIYADDIAELGYEFGDG